MSDKNEGENRKINLAEFVKKFAFNKFVTIYSEMNDNDIYVVKKCIEYLFELNENYVNKRMKKIKKNKFEKNNLRKQKIEESIYISEEECEKISDNSINFKNSFNQDENINDFFLRIKKIIKKEEKIKNENKDNICDLKKHLILQFEEIKKISDMALKKIWMASEKDLNNYTKNENKEIDILEKIKENYNKKQKTTTFFTDIFEKPLNTQKLKKSEKFINLKNSLKKNSENILNFQNSKPSENLLNLKNSQMSQKLKNENFMNFSNGNRSFGMTSNILNASKLKISGFDNIFLKSGKSDFCFKSNFDNNFKKSGIEENLKKSGFDPIFGTFKKSTCELDFLLHMK